MRLDGKTAVVTGGANGIGAGCIRRLAKEGANVVIADIDDAAGKALAEDLGAAAIYVRSDVSQRASVEAMFEATLHAFGAVDILVNNAAFVLKPGVIAKLSRLQRGLLAADTRCQPQRHVLLLPDGSSPDGETGALAASSSTSAAAALRARIAICLVTTPAKAALKRLRGSWRWILRLSISASTPLFRAAHALIMAASSAIRRSRRRMSSRSYVKGSPEDIAAAVAFLTSDDAAYITGTRIFVDGGMDAQLRTPSVDFRHDFSDWR